MTTTAMIMITAIRPPTAPPTAGPILFNINVDSVTGEVEAEILVDMPVTGSVFLLAVDVGGLITGELVVVVVPILGESVIGRGKAVVDLVVGMPTQNSLIEVDTTELLICKRAMKLV